MTNAERKRPQSKLKGEPMCKICKPSPKDESWDWDMEQDAREYLDSLEREEGKETDDGE